MVDASTEGAVLITGATGGIGSAIAHAVHSAGWSVGLLDLVKEPLLTLAGKLSTERPLSATYRAGDAADEATVQAWVDEAEAEFGTIAGLVNVAGRWHSTPIEALQFDEMDAMVRANLRTTLVCATITARAMLRSGRGSIVNIASTAGESGSISPAAHYAAAKGGVIAFTKSLARELSPRGIRVNAVSPGPIETRGLAAGSAIPTSETARRTLLGRVGTPAEIANCVTFLLGTESSFVTGEILRANGGSLL